MSSLLIYLIFFGALFYWMRRSDNKRKQAEQDKLNSLRPGMYVLLRDGLYGTIVDISGETMVVNVSVEGSDAGCMLMNKASVEAIHDFGTVPLSAGHEDVEESVVTTEYTAAPDGDNDGGEQA